MAIFDWLLPAAKTGTWMNNQNRDHAKDNQQFEQSETAGIGGSRMIRGADKMSFQRF